MRGKRWRKYWSMLLTAAILSSLFSAAVYSEESKQENGMANLLAWYEFQDGGTDSSGNQMDAVIGNGVTVEDGVASLPGGNSGGQAYITLPTGMFDAQDYLTISMWLKDEDPRDSWLGAFFFGSPANGNGVPENYFYFVPCERQHETLKSVLTNSYDASNPGSTEKGIRESVSTLGYVGNWTHYAVVLNPNSMSCYINGRLTETVEINRAVHEFGTDLESYIGRSNYAADPLYQGSFRDFRVYGSNLSQSEIREVMMEGYQGSSETYSMEIDGSNITKELSDSLYGLFYEDINSAADGGLYPEMVKNYSFENAYVQRGSNNNYFYQNGYETIGNYELHWDVNPSAAFTVEEQDGLNENNPHYAAITGNAVLQNGGFAPQSDPNGAAMAVKQGESYTFSTFARADSGYTGTLSVKLVDNSGKDLTDEQQVSLEADGTWKKVSAELTANVTEQTKGKMVLTVRDADSTEILNLDMVSVVPHDSYGYGDENYACGVGIRSDLLEEMMALNPKFLRFPGGCIVEGFNWEGIYDWRDTIGPLEERKSCTNRWENWNNQNHTWGYMQSYGFGYHEILTLCEDFDIEPFPIISAGVLCQYETADVAAKTGDDLDYFIQMAEDLLDYCWGDSTENEWAAKRAKNGHSEPFNLKYLGIGNENFQAKYFDNLDVIKEAVEEYAAAQYPERSLTIISSAGPTSTGDNLEYAYDRLAQTMAGETLVDEHYYESESFMYNQSDRYDYYERLNQGGSEIFVGEYAVKNDNKFNTALAEAAYITGLERNADIVTHISYAPLLYKVGSLNWSHDLIYFDEFDTAASANYYVQQMFANNYGSQLIGTELQSGSQDYSHYGSPILGIKNARGSIDKVTVYGADGTILFEDSFDDYSAGWKTFSTTLDSRESTDFTIENGKLNFTGTNGTILLYLPKAVEEKWSNYKIVVEGAKKTFGKGGVIVGAGNAEEYYWYNQASDDNTGTYMEVTRTYRGSSIPTRQILGNNYPNKHYQTEELTTVKNNDTMEITFNYGTNGKLEGSYTSLNVNSENTAKYDFSSELNQYQTDIYQVVNKDEDYVYIKLVNPDGDIKPIQLQFSNLPLAANTQAEITMLTGGLNEANAIGDEKVVPENTTQIIQEDQMTYYIPAYSVNVIRIPLVEGYTVTYQAEEGGFIKGDMTQIVAAGRDTKEVRAVAEEGYTFYQWDDGVTSAVRKETSVSENKTYTALFEKEPESETEAETEAETETEKQTEQAEETEREPEASGMILPSGIKLNVEKLTIGVGESVTLKATVLPTAALQKVTWKSGKSSVVSVNASGKIKGKKRGSAVITAVTENGKSIRCKVTVKKAPAKIALNKKKKTLKMGNTFQIKTKLPAKSASYRIVYRSSKKAVASVSANGKVTARKKGMTIITVTTFNKKKAKLKIRVK